VLFLGLPAEAGFGLGLDPGRIGVVLLVFGVAAFLGTLLAPRLAERAGLRVALVTGPLLTAAGYLLTVVAHGSMGAFVAWQALIGIGNGLVLAAFSTVVVTRAPADAVGISAGLFNTARTVGGAVAGAAFAAIMAALLVRPPGAAAAVTSEAGYVTVWIVCAALSLAVAAIAVVASQPARTPLARVAD
jgi:predicted MFS family arabinose efflux permease